AASWPPFPADSAASHKRLQRPARHSRPLPQFAGIVSGSVSRLRGSSVRRGRFLDELDQGAEGALRVHEGHRRPPAPRAGDVVDLGEHYWCLRKSVILSSPTLSRSSGFVMPRPSPGARQRTPILPSWRFWWICQAASPVASSG